jgi:hypothetical protein
MRSQSTESFTFSFLLVENTAKKIQLKKKPLLVRRPRLRAPVSIFSLLVTVTNHLFVCLLKRCETKATV